MRPFVRVAAALAALAVAAPAHAQSRDGGGVAAGPNRLNRAASPGRLAIVRAQTAYLARDYDAALAAYREAQRQTPERAEGTLGTGYVLAARNDAPGALAAF